MTIPEIESAFIYHAPNDEQGAHYRDLRETAKFFALNIQERCPESREKSLAITKLREALMWANASIAVNE